MPKRRGSRSRRPRDDLTGGAVAWSAPRRGRLDPRDDRLPSPELLRGPVPRRLGAELLVANRAHTRPEAVQVQADGRLGIAAIAAFDAEAFDALRHRDEPPKAAETHARTRCRAAWLRLARIAIASSSAVIDGRAGD